MLVGIAAVVATAVLASALIAVLVDTVHRQIIQHRWSAPLPPSFVLAVVATATGAMPG